MAYKRVVTTRRRISKRVLTFFLCFLLSIGQGFHTGAKADESGVLFAGFNEQNVNLDEANWSTIDAVVDSSITMSGADSHAAYYINLNSIAESVDCGTLSIDFSVDCAIGEEDPPDTGLVHISFRATEGGTDLGSVLLERGSDDPGSAVSLSSGAGIPTGTRFIFIDLTGIDGSGGEGDVDNTVVFTNPFLYIRDNADPMLTSEYSDVWTNGEVTVTLTSTDTQSGVEGIYDASNGSKLSGSEPYQYTVSANGSRSFYATDYAGRSSEIITVSITNIDTHAPSGPPDILLDTGAWSATPVTFSLAPVDPEEGASPEVAQYRLNAGEWTAYSGEVTVSEEGETVITVRTADAAGNISDIATANAYIDTMSPIITDLSAVALPEGGATVTFIVNDGEGSGLTEKRWAAGVQDAAYFAENGTVLEGDTFSIGEGGDFTVYAVDAAGNVTRDTINVNTYPTLEAIPAQVLDEDSTKDILFAVGDSESAAGDLTITAASSDTPLLPDPVCVNDGGNVTLTLAPALNQHGGPVTVTVSVTDEGGNTATGTFDVTVNSVNDAPVAADDDAVNTIEDQAVTIAVLANDTDADGDALHVTAAGEPAHGSVSITGDGLSVIYTPDANFNGTDSFTYTAGDGTDASNTATVTVTVSEANDTPTANTDHITILEDQTPLIDVLANDTDADLGTASDEALTIVSVDTIPGVTLGTPVIEDNQVRYTPPLDWSGADRFTYIIEDRAGISSSATVYLNVQPFNDPPVFTGLASSYTIEEDSGEYTIPFQISDVETADASLMLQVAVDTDKISGITLAGLGDESTDTSLSFTPRSNANGDVEITLRLSDGFQVTTAAFMLHITPVNDLPVAVADTYTFTEDDESLIIDMDDLVSNDTDIDGDALHFVSIADGPNDGTLESVDAGDHTYRYIPPEDFDGSATFHYVMTDGTDTATGQVTLIADAINDAPVITMDPANVYATDEDVALVGLHFTISDLESTPSSLVVTAGTSDPDLVSVQNITVSKGADGLCSLSITPNPDQNGTATITLSASDGLLLTSTSFTITVGPVEDLPVAVDDYLTVAKGGSAPIEPLLNDRDADDDALTITGYTQPEHGTVTRSGDILTYRGAAGYSGSDSFTYDISDGDDSATGTVHVAVGSYSFPPAITPVANQYLNEDNATGPLPFSVSDPDGDALTVTAASDNTGLVPEDEDHLALVDLGDGEYTVAVTPLANASGTADITLTVNDGSSNRSTVFTVTVYPVNDLPIAADDDISLDEDDSVTFDVLDNDSDLETTDLEIISSTEPTHGILTRSGGSYTYTPFVNYNGADSFSYVMTDGEASEAATVNITVDPVNDRPWTYNIWRELPNTAGTETTDPSINILGKCHDVDGDTLYLDSVVTAPAYGTLDIDYENGTAVYTRNQVSPDDNGADSFIVKVRDRADAEAEDVLTVNVTVYIGVDFVPSLTIRSVAKTAYEDDAPFWIDLDVSNPNGNPLTITTGEPGLGSIDAIDTDGYRILFHPDSDANGSESFTYTVKDATVDPVQERTATVHLILYAVNDAPEFTAVPSDQEIDEDTSTEPLTITFTDVDATDDLVFTAYSQNPDSQHPILLDEGIDAVRDGDTVTLTLTPVTNANGTVPVTLLVSDGLVNSTHTFDLTVDPVNDDPVARNQSVVMQEDTETAITVLSPNSDVDGDALTVSISTEPDHGTATVESDSTITYVPDADYYGSDSFVYEFDDSHGGTDMGSVFISVENVNDLPVISGLHYQNDTQEDHAASIPFHINDVDGDELTVSFTHTNGDLFPEGRIEVAGEDGDRTIEADPAADAYGSDAITLTVSDGTGATVQDLVLTVLSVNDLPTALDDSYEIDEDTPTVFSVLDNDTDIEDGANLDVVEVSTTANGGRVTNAHDGTLTYVPAANYFGPDIFVYTVSDSNDGQDTAIVHITVNPVNDRPDAVNDAAATQEDTPVTISVLANDSDVEGDTLTVLSTAGAALAQDITINGDGTLTYIPALNANGTDTFTYTVSDGQAENSINTGTVTVTIGAVNDAPKIKNDDDANPLPWTFDEDTDGVFLFTVSDPETDAKNLIVTLSSSDQDLVPDTSIELSGTGTNKTATLTPEPEVSGDLKITVTASDGVNTTTEDFDVHINSVNDRPTITTHDRETPEDTNVSDTATGSDVENSTLTFSLREEAGDGPTHGTVTVQSNGHWTYSPDDNYYGTDSFVIVVDDGSGTDNSTNFSTVTITVKSRNDDPVAVADSATVEEDHGITIDVLANDSDVDTGDSISLVEGGISGVDHGSAAIVDGKIVFTPAENWNGTEVFTYTIQDTGESTADANVTVTVNAVNDAPYQGDDKYKGDDHYTVAEDSTNTFHVLTNDDVDTTTNGETLTVTDIVSGPSHGTITAWDGTSITYKPDANYYGEDSFDYSMRDDSGLADHTASFTVTITVTPVNDDPVISTIGDQDGTEDHTLGPISFTVNDVEDDAGTLSVSAVCTENPALFPNDGSHIIIGASGESGDPARTITLVPAANENGTAQITITVEDSGDKTAASAFTVDIASVNDDPTPQDDGDEVMIEVTEGDSVDIDVLANDDIDLDFEGDMLDILTVSDVDDTHLGVAEIIDGADREEIRFTPDEDWTSKVDAVEELVYTMTDAANPTGSYSAHIFITIHPYNDAPQIGDVGDIEINEDQEDGTGLISFTVSDEEDDDNTLYVSAVSRIEDQTLIPDSNITIDNPDGDGATRTIQCVPLENQNGEAVITLTVRDEEGLIATDTFTVTVRPMDDSPTGGDDEYTIDEDTATDFDILTNDDVDAGTNPDLESLEVTSVTDPAHGSASVISGGDQIRYIPDTNWYGDDSFQYDMETKEGDTATFTVVVHVNPVNDAPDINSTIETQTVDEGAVMGPLVFTVTDVDDDDDTLIVSAISNNQILIPNENITVTNLGGPHRSISLAPYGKWNGTATITITVRDDDNASDTGSVATFAVRVQSINEAPVAHDDSYIINEDVAMTLPVLGNDTDGDLATNPDTETMTITGVAGVDNAAVTMTGGNTRLLFTPRADWNGTEEFTYTIRDTAGETDTATVRVKVNGKNDAPVAANDAGTTDEDTALIIDALSNDSDIDTDATLNTDPNADPADESISLVPDGFSGVDNGTAEITDGKIRYTPADDWNGIEIFTYTVRDAAGVTATASVTVTVDPINDAPVADDDAPSTPEDTPVTVTVLANDLDVDQSPALNHPVTDTWAVTLGDEPSHGEIVLNGDNTVTYTPDENWNGADTFTYTVTDSVGASDTATITVTVGPVNDVPTAIADTAYTYEDTAVDIDVLANDSDIDAKETLNEGGAPGAESLTIDPEGFSGVDHGTVSVVDGKVHFIPEHDWNGTEVFSYTARDNAGAGDAATVTVTVTGVNDAPVAYSDTASVDEDGSVLIPVLVNDEDVDMDALLNKDIGVIDALSIDPDGCTDIDGNELTDTDEDGFIEAAHGDVGIEGNQLRFIPDANWNGVTVFKYTVADIGGRTDTATVTVTVTPLNDTPAAVNDTGSTTEDTAVLIDALANDTDIDKDASLNADPGAESLSLVSDGFSDVDHGTASVSGGKVRFVPQADWNGAETFTYTMRDAAGATGTASITVTVSGANDLPVAADDTAETVEDIPVDIDALANDYDVDMDHDLNQDPSANPDDESIFIAAGGFSNVDHGTASVVDGKIYFVPDKDWNGIEIFDYTVSDGIETDTATVTVTVQSNNNDPVAVADAASTNEDVPVSIDVLGNDTDVDIGIEGDVLTILSTADLTHGTVEIAPDGKSLTYNPDAEWNGTEVFSYTIRDKEDVQSTALVTVTVAPVNDPPTANADAAETDEDADIEIDVLANDIDVDLAMEGDTLTILSTADVDHGTVSIAGDGSTLTYSPAAEWSGTEVFTYTMQDGDGESSTASVTVEVAAVDDPPIGVALLTPDTDSYYKDGQTVPVTWTAAADPEGNAVSYSLYFYNGTAWNLLAADLTGTAYDHVLADTRLATDRARYRVEATDGATVSSDTGDYFIIDNAAPMNVKATLISGSAPLGSEEWTNSDVRFRLSGGTDLLPFIYEYKYGGKSWTKLNEGASASFTDTGVYKVDYRATDLLGNVYTGSVGIRVDKRPPAVRGVSFSTVEPTREEVGITMALGPDPGDSGNATVTLPDGREIPAADIITWTAKENGDYIFVIEDSAGNTLEVPVTIDNIDRVGPVITIDNHGYRYGDWSREPLPADLTFTDADSGIRIRQYFTAGHEGGSGTYQAYAGTIKFDVDGQHYIHAYAEDMAGNATVAVFGPYLVDATPPDLSYETDITDEDGVIRGSVGDAASGVARLTLPDGTVIDNPGAHFTYDVNTGGDYVFELTDAAGNTSRRTVAVTMLAPPVPDTTPSPGSTPGPSVAPAFIPSVIDKAEEIARNMVLGFSEFFSQASSTAIWIAVAAAAAGGSGGIIIIYWVMRPVKIEYFGTRNGRKRRRVRRRFAKLPRKGGILKLVLKRKADGMEVTNITVTLHRRFSRRMRERYVRLRSDGVFIGEGYVPGDQRGRWTKTFPLS